MNIKDLTISRDGKLRTRAPKSCAPFCRTLLSCQNPLNIYMVSKNQVFHENPVFFRFTNKCLGQLRRWVAAVSPGAPRWQGRKGRIWYHSNDFPIYRPILTSGLLMSSKTTSGVTSREKLRMVRDREPEKNWVFMKNLICWPNMATERVLKRQKCA